MTTLRRELRTKFEGILKGFVVELLKTDSTNLLVENTINKLADAALELRAFSFQPKTIEEAIYAGVPVPEEVVEKEKTRQEVTRLFEKSLGFSKPLPWWNGKDWTAFGEWVCERYKENNFCFGEYNIWRNTQYTKGGMANTRIRGFVTEFYDSWDMFMMSRKPKTDEERPEYQPFKFLEDK